MDKQQAAAEYSALKAKERFVCTTENIRLNANADYTAGWEAHEAQSPTDAPRLNLKLLRQLIVQRAKEGFKTYDNQPITYWTTALAGELGELCNMVKKIQRVALGGVDGGHSYSAKDITTEMLKEEIGGIALYLDLVAGLLNISLEDAIIDTFNTKSREYNWQWLLPEGPSGAEHPPCLCHSDKEHENCTVDCDWYNSRITASGHSLVDYENEPSTARQSAQAAGPVQQDKNFTVRLKAIVNRLLAEAGVFSMCEDYDNPKLAAFCKSLETVKLTDINKSPEAEVSSAGLVWVKASDRLPQEDKRVITRWKNSKGGPYIEMFYAKDIAGWNNGGYYAAESMEDIFWLDESGLQVFTREQIIEIAKFCMVEVKAGDLKNFCHFMEYMNTNYPQP